MKNNEFTKCIAIRDFVGDQKLNQLQFTVNTPLEINFNDPPQNGWRLGRVNNKYGVQQGWCPEWSFALPPNNNGTPPPPPMAAPPPPPSSLSPRPPPSQQQQQHQFQPSNVPVAGVDIAAFNGSGISGISGEFGGFDQRNNDVMGGNIPRAKTADGNDMKNHLNPFEDVPDVTRADNNNKWNVSGIKKLLTPPKFHTNNDSNPYTQKQKEPESDWTDGPQIMTNDMAALGNNNGRIAVIDTDGTTTTYKNEQSYQLATARNQFTDTMKTTTANVSHQIQNLNLKLPDISKMHMNHNNTNDNNNNGNSNNTSGDNTNNNNNDNKGQQQQQQQQQQNLVIDVNDDYTIDNEKTHNNIMNKFGRNVTKISKKVSRSLSPKQQAYH